MPKGKSYCDAVSKAVARALDMYHQAAPEGQEAEVVGRVFEAYLSAFRRVAWAATNAADLIHIVETMIGPLPEWVKEGFEGGGKG